jgi:hypothetical protein
MSVTLTDLGISQSALDAQGRVLIGADLDVPANGQSAANASQSVATATGLKRRILYATIQYSTTVSLSVTVTLLSALGAAWNTVLATVVFTAQAGGVWVPPHAEFIIAPGDSIQVTAPAGGGGVTSAIAIYNEILGLTSRAVDATS